MPTNDLQTTKYGIEYSLNLGRIDQLNTSIELNGAWMYSKTRPTGVSYSFQQRTTLWQGDYYPYVGVMSALGSTTSIISQRVNTNFRFITHIPKIKMIFTTTVQVVWSENFQRMNEDENGNPLFYKKIDPSSATQAESYFMNPIGFIDRSGNFNEWKPEYETSENFKYRRMISSVTFLDSFEKEKYPVYTIMNFRLTKEFGKMMELSFIANNFFKTVKVHKMKTNIQWVDLTIPMYFGAEIKIKI